MEYIIFGGTFDPFTKAHGCIVEIVASAHPDAKILIVPSVVTWHRKDKPALFGEPDRKYIINYWLTEKMPSALVGRVLLDAHEYDLPDKMREGRGFVDYLRFIVEKHIGDLAENTYRFVVGEDEWAIFDKWKTHEEILRLAHPIVVRRGVAGARTPFLEVDGTEEVIDLPAWCAEVSASAIREKIDGCQRKLLTYCNTPDFWAIPREELLLHTPIFDVKKVDSDIPGFHPIRVESRDWVCVIVRKGGKYIGVRQTRWGTGKKYDDFVTGVVDPGEVPREAAVRELREELGIALSDMSEMWFIGSAPSNPGFMTNTMHYYYLDLDSVPQHEYTECPPTPDKHERLERVEFDLDDCFKGQTPALMLAGLALVNENIYKLPKPLKMVRTIDNNHCSTTERVHEAEGWIVNSMPEGKPMCPYGKVAPDGCGFCTGKGACTFYVLESFPPKYNMCPFRGSGYILCSEAN